MGNGELVLSVPLLLSKLRLRFRREAEVFVICYFLSSFPSPISPSCYLINHLGNKKVFIICLLMELYAIALGSFSAILLSLLAKNNALV